MYGRRTEIVSRNACPHAARKNAARTGLSHACRVGAARGHLAAWPHNPEDWPGKFQAIPWLYAEIVRLLAARERVHLLVEDAKAQQRAHGILERAGANLEQVSFHLWPTNRSWTRDSGPIFVRNGEGKVGITNWRFNAWAKYSDWPLDDQLPGRVTELLGLPEWQPAVEQADGFAQRLVLEGGSIDTNGAGILLTTEECLLSEVQERNPGVSRGQMEQAFHDYLGIDQVIWLNRGIAGDDTHGHIDDITRFVGPGTIVTCVEPKTSDPNHAPLAENLNRLNAARTLDGKQFDLVELPMPQPVVFRSQRLPASYANFYIANRLVLVPTFSRRERPRGAEHAGGGLSGARSHWHSCVDLVWGWARCIA